MGTVNEFADIDALILQARAAFRDNKGLGEIEKVFDLYFAFARSIGKFQSQKDWEGGRDEYIIKILSKAIQSLLGMLYLSESGFYDLALSLERNYIELLLIAIAVGYDDRNFTDWERGASDFRNAHKVAKKITASANVPAPEKEIVTHLTKEWETASSRYAHELHIGNVEEIIQSGEIHLGVVIADEAMRAKRLETIRSMALNVITVLVGVFRYDTVTIKDKKRFPEALTLIAAFNSMQKDE